MRIDSRHLDRHICPHPHGPAGELVNQLEHAQVKILVLHRHQGLEVLQQGRCNQLIAVTAEVVEQGSTHLFGLARLGRQDISDILG